MRTLKLLTIVAAVLLDAGLMWLVIAPTQDAALPAKVMMAGAIVVFVATALTYLAYVAGESFAAHFAAHLHRSDAFIWNPTEAAPSASANTSTGQLPA